MAASLTRMARGIVESPRVLSVIEAMATPHAVDRYTELVDPMFTARDLRAEVTAVHRENDQSVTLTLRPTRQWRGFAAGQFIQIGVVVDGVRHFRCFSPCNSEHRADGALELTVKAGDDGLVSAYLYRQVRPGSVVDLEQADGAFRLPAERPDDLVLISGGSGITPVLSMLRTLVDEGHRGRVAFLHYVDRPENLVHAHELRRIAATQENVTVAVSYTGRGAGTAEAALPESPPDGMLEAGVLEDGLKGRFASEHLAVAAPWFADAETYLCGPAPMMDTVRETYDRHGLGDVLHTEAFTVSRVIPDEDAAGTVTFSASGTSADNSGETILEQAEGAGLSPEYGCRMGICFSCTAVRRSGCTRNVVSGEVDADPDQSIQLCINVPVGDVDVEV